MPLNPLVKELIKATVTGSPEGKLGACIINNTPVVTHLFDNDCVPITYTRIIRRKPKHINLGRVVKELDGIRGSIYRYLIRIMINGAVYEVKVNSMYTLGLTGMAIDGDYIVFKGSPFTYIINPINIPTGLEEAANRLKLPELEYTIVTEDSLEGSLLSSTIHSTSYYYSSSWHGFLYICSGGIKEEPPDDEDCLPVRYMRRTINDIGLNITREFSIAGVNAEALVSKSSWIYPVFVRLLSNHDTARAYALVYKQRHGNEDAVLISTPSLRRFLKEAMSTVSTINSAQDSSELLSESGLT